MNYGHKIAETRSSKGLAVTELAALLNIPKDRIYKWEKGKAEPKHEDRLKLDAWLNGKISTPDSTNVAEADVPYGTNWKDKYYEALEKNQVAVEQLAEAAIKVSHEAIISLRELRTQVNRNQLRAGGFELAVTNRFAAIEKLKPQVVAKAFDKELREFAKANSLSNMAETGS